MENTNTNILGGGRGREGQFKKNYDFLLIKKKCEYKFE